MPNTTNFIDSIKSIKSLPGHSSFIHILSKNTHIRPLCGPANCKLKLIYCLKGPNDLNNNCG